MKRMLTAAVAAMALVGGLAQEASAWCKFNFGGGVNLGFESGGSYVKRGGSERGSYPPPGAGGYGGFGGGVGGFAAPEAPEPLPNAPAPKSKTSAPIQAIGYYTYPSYGYQTPTVWWGN